MFVKPFFSKMLLGVIILLGVGSCDSRFDVDAVLSQYIMDLSRSSSLSFPTVAIAMPESLPSSRHRRQALSQFDIGLLDFLSLQQCDVGIVAGKKNSILGKVMPDSQRFLYELDIIRAIESCDIQNDELSKELQYVAQQKRVELPIAFGNAIFNGVESEAFFSLSNGFLPLNYSTALQQEMLSALNRLLVIGENLAALPVIDAHVFESDLKILMDSEYAGRLLYSLTQMTGYLNQVSRQIGGLDEGVCGAPMRYLKQQFEANYVQIIQPYMGRVNASAYQVLPLINRLAVSSAPLSGDMQGFMRQFSVADSVWLRYQQASQMHAKHWSALFDVCSISLQTR
ncbi:DUF3080 domain-containing protein [Marinomonas sp. M1K-6]|uniref:DUF3080 domain-containing protein n=1 Tax=Marinomonas profundi TaxID=2726122 RepID=A0A847R1N4_9GAMM|nr:DUF3080 family protein [Marinomonas profundi]NLQ17622.1 DUF3080 domain-containing protein [Marinomonas profundi]UDV02161.1 DUF3080 domain-containing protein [Marinomonas profundi]